MSCKYEGLKKESNIIQIQVELSKWDDQKKKNHLQGLRICINLMRE